MKSTKRNSFIGSDSSFLLSFLEFLNGLSFLFSSLVLFLVFCLLLTLLNSLPALLSSSESDDIFEADMLSALIFFEKA